jgi:hypothetical protein
MAIALSIVALSVVGLLVVMIVISLEKSPPKRMSTLEEAKYELHASNRTQDVDDILYPNKIEA